MCLTFQFLMAGGGKLSMVQTAGQLAKTPTSIQRYRTAQISEFLYDTLENKIVPLFYGDRGSEDIPHKWVVMIKELIRTIAPQFSTRRMMKEYLDRLYIPAMK